MHTLHTVNMFFLVFLVILDLPVMLYLGKLFFGSLAGFGEALKESWLLQWTFFWNSDWYNREVANFMVETYFLLCAGIVAGEAYLLHLW